MRIDHVVLNAKTELNALESAFRRLGFRLSERGFHSLGSINHVAMLEGGYLELIGVPRENPDIRPEVSHGRTGIDGLVFGTDDAVRTREFLRSCGFRPTEVQEFSRPVQLGDGVAEARFRTVRLIGEPFAAGRVYFCQHLTPELVWRPGSFDHPNGSRRITEVVVVSARAEEQAGRLGLLAGRAAELDGADLCVPFDDCLLRIVSPESYGRRYGPAALVVENSPEFFGAVVIQCDELAFLAECAVVDDWKCLSSADGGIRVFSPTRGVLLDFRR